MSAAPRCPWVVVVPLKGLDAAKSRLSALGAPTRAQVALAMAQDCVSACVEAVGAGQVLVVTSDPRIAAAMKALGAAVQPDAGDGLNAAARAGADRARRDHPGAGVAVVVGDLPCLRAHDLRQVLDAAAAIPRAFVPDAEGTGTVIVTARPGVTLEPRFGPGSAARHAALGARLEAPALVRLDRSESVV